MGSKDCCSDKKLNYKSLIFPLVAVLTLGLAPHYPEPHLFEKLRWIFIEERPMASIDWFDVMWHGSPWVWFLWVFFASLKTRYGLKK